jgi:hypothetical protein
MGTSEELFFGNISLEVIHDRTENNDQGCFKRDVYSDKRGIHDIGNPCSFTASCLDM